MIIEPGEIVRVSSGTMLYHYREDGSVNVSEVVYAPKTGIVIATTTGSDLGAGYESLILFDGACAYVLSGYFSRLHL